MTKDLIKTLRRLQKTFTDVLDDTGLNDLEMYVNGVWRGLEIAIQEISERDLEQAYTDKCAENAQGPVEGFEEIPFETGDHVPESVTTDMEILSCLSDEESEETSGEPADESSASLPENYTEPLKFNPYKESNKPEEILEYLSKVSVQILDSKCFDSLMSMLEIKTDSMWRSSSSPTFHKGSFYMLPDDLSIYPDISFIHKDRIISFSEAMDLLERLPDKD